MQQYDILVKAQSPFVVGAAGRYIKYIAGNNGGGDVSLSVTPGHQGGNKLTLLPGQAYRVADDAPTPDSWTFANKAGGADITGSVVIGNGRIDDTSVAGTVQVVDGGKTRTLSGAAFSVNGIAGAATAGQYSRLQLWNPVGSGKRLVVESLNGAQAGSAEGVFISFANVQIANAQGAGLAKLAGAPNSTAGLTYIDTTAAAFASPALANMQILASGSASTQVKPVEPLIVPPGWGILLWGNALNTTFACQFEWYEEPNV